MSDSPTDERRLAVGAVRILGLMAVPTGAFAWLVAGPAGAASALIGLGLVLVLFGASALVLAWAAGRGSDAGFGLLVGGVVGRLMLYVLTLSVLGQMSWVHRPSLALATVAAIALTLAYELRLLAASPRLFWVDAAAKSPSTSPAGLPAASAAGPPTSAASRPSNATGRRSL